MDIVGLINMMYHIVVFGLVIPLSCLALTGSVVVLIRTWSNADLDTDERIRAIALGLALFVTGYCGYSLFKGAETTLLIKETASAQE